MDGRPGVTVGAFDAFYARMRRPLAALAYAASGSALAADDLAQDALEAAYRDYATAPPRRPSHRTAR
jgi:DNA-directed RNA polymerase specialized sigma24 family protein